MVSNDDFGKTLAEVGHRISKCESPTSCSKAMSEGKFDVVLADPSDAAKLKSSGSPLGLAVVPVMLKASKEDLKSAKATFGEAFDASRGSLRLLSVLNQAAKGTR